MSEPEPYWAVSLDDEVPQTIRIRRTGRLYPDLDAVEAGYAKLYAELFDLELEVRQPWAMLMDLRAAPPARNDPQFEAIHRSHRPKLFDLFLFRVILVNTASGLMQLTRMRREDRGGFEVVADERLARQMCWTELDEFLDRPTKP